MEWIVAAVVAIALAAFATRHMWIDSTGEDHHDSREF
jgi:hypothetical protein